MSALGNFFLIDPKQWMFSTHGDVVEGKRRAQEWFGRYGTYEGAELYIEEFVRQWALFQLLNAFFLQRHYNTFQKTRGTRSPSTTCMNSNFFTYMELRNLTEWFGSP
ncbi:MAG: hypothetical protein HWQ43_14385 [Nostoc sp. JL31]|nr:hypothetical protein [Nostoc sp. JL31]